MATLSSRPPAVISAAPTQQDVIDAASASINVLNWISQIIVYHDDSQRTIAAAHQTIEDALDCFKYPDFVVMAAPGTMTTLHYDVAVKPIENAQYVAFKVIFRIQP